MTEQLVIGPAPTFSNEEGPRRAVSQIRTITARDWYVYFNRRQDIFYLRKRDHGPATSYFLPDAPEVLFGLDGEGNLVGIDMADFRRAITKERPEFGFVLRGWYAHRVLAHIPAFRAVAEMLSRGVRSRARDDIQNMSTHLCPS